MWGFDDAAGWGVLWMGLMMAVFWVPLLLIPLWALRASGRRSTRDERRSRDPEPPEPDARELARRSYARGDIDRDRYLQIVQDLQETERA